MFCGENYRKSPERHFAGRQTEWEREEDREQIGENTWERDESHAALLEFIEEAGSGQAPQGEMAHANVISEAYN